MQMITIDENFKQLIPPLTKEEYELLEQSIIEEGCRDAIAIWNNKIIDGHNRYEICSKHNIPFLTKTMRFISEDEVKAWMLKNQMGRRNLTDKQRAELIGKIYRQEKKIISNDKGINQHTKEVDGQNVQQATSEKIAQQYGINEKTVRRNEKFADAIDTIKENLGNETASKILTDEIPIPKTEAIKLAREEPEVQKKIIPIFETGQTKKVEEAKKIIDPVDEQYDKDVIEIEARHKRIKKVMNLLNYTQYLGITEQSVLEYIEDTPKGHFDFVSRLNKLKDIINETIEIYNKLQQIRRIK